MGANKSNLIHIRTTQKQLTSTGSGHNSFTFVPSLMLSNVMSLAPKIDELRVSIANSNVDVVCITETWLKGHIEDHVVSVAGYHIARKDRKSIEHGGVCTYVRDSIRFKTLDYLMKMISKSCGCNYLQSDSLEAYHP